MGFCWSDLLVYTRLLHFFLFGRLSWDHRHIFFVGFGSASIAVVDQTSRSFAPQSLFTRFQR